MIHFLAGEDILSFIIISILAVKPTQLTLKFVAWELSSPINWLKSVEEPLPCSVRLKMLKCLFSMSFICSQGVLLMYSGSFSLTGNFTLP
jgi:hypothetical protein